jgi:hypothetical protein
MKPKFTRLGTFALVTAFSFAPLALGQEGAGSPSSPPSSPSGSTDQHYTGSSSIKDSAKSAGSTVENGAKSAYHGVRSSAVTALAKAALLKDDQTRHSTIHIHTAKNGVVTLSGRVASKATADHAEEVVARLDGVKSVRNRLKYENSTSSDENAPSRMHENAPSTNQQAPSATEPNAPAERMAPPAAAQ